MVPIIIGGGSPNDSESIPLATRDGKHIPNERRLERHPNALKAGIQILAKSHPNAKFRSATAIYNCMGMVFASRRTWIDTIYVRKILSEDRYDPLAGAIEAEIGDIVIYKTGQEVTHVAIIIDKKANIESASWEIKVLSKWGADAEYIHTVDDLPESLGKPVEYWTDRKKFDAV